MAEGTTTPTTTPTPAHEARRSRVLVVLNPQSGTCTAADVREALGRHFSCDDGACRVHEIQSGDDVKRIVREAVGQGLDLVIAAGGDGTVSAVANGLGAGSSTPLGIIPLGTANVLARELGVPIDLDAACALLAGEHAAKGVDAMQVDEAMYFTQIGVGIDSLMIRDTDTQEKRRLGRLAYLRSAAMHLFGFQPRRFSLMVDDQKLRPRASQVLVANGGILGQPPFRWGPNIRPDDGRLDVCIVRARTLFDYTVLAWLVVRGQHRRSPNVQYLAAERAIAINADRPLPVQADGEIIGETPVQVQVLRSAVQVIIPPPGSGTPLEAEDQGQT